MSPTIKEVAASSIDVAELRHYRLSRIQRELRALDVREAIPLATFHHLDSKAAAACA